MKNVSIFCLLFVFLISCKSPKSSTNEETNTVVSVVQIDSDTTKRQVSLEEALAKINQGNGVFAKMLENKSMFVGLYTPKETDNQRPHDKDEVYIIANGSGKFLNGKDTTAFKEDDVIFVPAGEEHRFLDFSEDFKAWVVFY